MIDDNFFKDDYSYEVAEKVFGKRELYMEEDGKLLLNAAMTHAFNKKSKVYIL